MKRALMTIGILIAAAMLLIADRSTTAKAASALDKEAPTFELPDLSGQKRKLVDYRGKVTVVTFLSAKCPVSADYNERVATISRDFAKRGVSFLAINANSDESIQVIREHARANGFQFPILKDEAGTVAAA